MGRKAIKIGSAKKSPAPAAPEKDLADDRPTLPFRCPGCDCIVTARRLNAGAVDFVEAHDRFGCPECGQVYALKFAEVKK